MPWDGRCAWPFDRFDKLTGAGLRTGEQAALCVDGTVFSYVSYVSRFPFFNYERRKIHEKEEATNTIETEIRRVG